MFSKSKRDVQDKELPSSYLEIYKELFDKYECENYKDLMDISRNDIERFEMRLKKGSAIYNAWKCSIGQERHIIRPGEIGMCHKQFFTYNDIPAPKLIDILGKDSPALQNMEIFRKPLDLDMFVGSADGELALYRYLMGSSVEFGKVLKSLSDNGIHLSSKDYDYANIGSLTMNDILYIFKRDKFITDTTFNSLNSRHHETIDELVQMYNSGHPRWSEMYSVIQKEALDLFKLLGYDKNVQGKLIPIHDMKIDRSKYVSLGENNHSNPIGSNHIPQVNDYTILGLVAGNNIKVSIDDVSNSSQFWDTFGNYIKARVNDSGLEHDYKKELVKYVDDRIKSFTNDGSCM